MKKFKLLLVIMFGILILPFNVFAEENGDSKEEKTEVNVYLFRGDGCSFCAAAEEWFDSIEGEYGDKFTIVDYETWYNEENAALMQKVADARKEEASGVPYIIIGDKSWNGFDESYQDEMIDAIEDTYKQNTADRYDIMALLGELPKTEEKSSSSDFVALILIVLITAGFITGIVFARKKTN